MTDQSPGELADGLSAVLHGAEAALTDGELDAVGNAMDYLRQLESDAA